MRALFRWSLTVTASIFLGTGCASVKKVTDQERTQSFAPLESLAVGTDSLHDYILKRTGVLVVAELASFEHLDDNRVTITARAPQKLIYGSAAPVDRRGYFVTAAHCLEGPAVGVTFLTQTGMEVKQARIVFKGDPASSVSDFAVLHVPVKLDHVLDWGTEFGPGETVVSSGIKRTGTARRSKSAKIGYSVDPVGGHIAKAVRETADGVGYHYILHDSPLAPGNSGGPMIDQKGRLIGVNIEGAAAHPAFHDPKRRYAIAVRPDLDWLKRVIEADAAAQAPMGRIGPISRRNTVSRAGASAW